MLPRAPSACQNPLSSCGLRTDARIVAFGARAQASDELAARPCPNVRASYGGLFKPRSRACVCATMPPKKAAAPKKAHESVGVLRFYAGSVVVFASAGLSYVLAQAGDEPLMASLKMWLMNAALCLVASWLTWDHSWRVHALAVLSECTCASPSAPPSRVAMPHAATGSTVCGP